MRYGLRVILRKTTGALLQINPAKGYGRSWTIGLNLDGSDWKGGGERVTGQREKMAWRSSITGGEKLPRALRLGPRGHDLMSREHRE